MKTFKDYYKLPLKPMEGLEFIKVLTSDNKPAFDWCENFSKTQIDEWLRNINHGEYCMIMKIPKSVFSYKDGIIREDCEGKTLFNDKISIHKNILKIRGFGMLTDNPYHLSLDEAIKIQDEFGEYICKMLNK